jgi:tRNA 2-selenouridine synthase
VKADALHQLFDNFDAIIDVRSPSEWAADHVPGAINFPVLSDSERQEIGTLYAASAFEAKRAGAARVAFNIAQHLEGPLKDKPRSWRPLVYCWRGGNRSHAMAHVLQKIGWRAEVLEGGYAEFRRFVTRDLERLVAGFQYRIVCGVTGSGKSLYLRELAQEGQQVLDLEALAHHRGSLLGSEPEGEQPSQKAFETMIWDCLRKLDPTREIHVESESRKIGALQVPQALIERMRESPCIELRPDMQERVMFLCQEYAHFFGQAALLKEKLSKLAPFIGHERLAHWNELIDTQQWQALVQQLLVEHYDPSYRRSMRKNYLQYSQADAVVGHPAFVNGLSKEAA